MPKMESGEDPGAYLKRVANWKDKQGEASAPTTDVVPTDETKNIEPPKDQGEPEKEAATEPDKAEAKPEEDDENVDPLKEAAREALGKGTTLAPKELRAKINASPELKAALAADPELGHSLFRMSREASEAANYRELFPTTEDAQFAHQMANQLGELQSLFSDATDVDSTSSLIAKLVEMTYDVDANGEIVKDPQTGQPTSDGSVGRFLDNVTNMALDFYANRAEEEGNDALLAAVQVLKASMGATAPQDEDLPEHIKKERDAINAEKETLHRQQLDSLQRQHGDFEQKVATQIDSQINQLVTSLISGTNISEFNRKTAIAEITKELLAHLKKDQLFLHRRDDLMRRGYSDDVASKRVGLAMSRVNKAIGRIAAPILREAGANSLNSQEKVASKIATQVETSRIEPKGGSRPVATPAKPSVPQTITQFREQYAKEHGGRTPSEAEIYAHLGAQ
jgi:hypothetical protein